MAQVDDIPELVRIGRRMHFESRYSRFNFDGGKYAAFLGQVLPHGLTFVAEEGARLVGAFIGHVGPHFFGHDYASWDVLTYVDPEYRGRVGVMLIRRYIAMAEAMGISDIHIGTSTGLSPERTGRLYEHLGFRHIGGGYVMEK